MTTGNNADLSRQLGQDIQALTDSQIEWVARIIGQFRLPKAFSRNPASDLVTDKWLENFGNVLTVHHAMSEAPFSKEKFEFAFVFASRKAGLSADKTTGRTNRGHDVTVAGARISLKTQADKGIAENYIHISKFMELGKGEWELDILRGHFLSHMRAYQRIFSLRAFSRNTAPNIRYELVEIPMALFERASQGTLRWAVGSKQTPTPGFCDVLDEEGRPAFQLYFDGGTERKLQVRSIRLDLCMVHAEWEFELASLFEVSAGAGPGNAS